MQAMCIYARKFQLLISNRLTHWNRQSLIINQKSPENRKKKKTNKQIFGKNVQSEPESIFQICIEWPNRIIFGHYILFFVSPINKNWNIFERISLKLKFQKTYFLFFSIHFGLHKFSCWNTFNFIILNVLVSHWNVVRKKFQRYKNWIVVCNHYCDNIAKRIIQENEIWHVSGICDIIFVRIYNKVKWKE